MRSPMKRFFLAAALVVAVLAACGGGSKSDKAMHMPPMIITPHPLGVEPDDAVESPSDPANQNEPTQPESPPDPMPGVKRDNTSPTNSR